MTPQFLNKSYPLVFYSLPHIKIKVNSLLDYPSSNFSLAHFLLPNPLFYLGNYILSIYHLYKKNYVQFFQFLACYILYFSLLKHNKL